MMMYLGRFFGWAALASTALLSTIAMRHLQADPSDDFSFATFQYEPVVELPSPITEQQVIQVLLDRLDLFPRSHVPSLARHLMRLCRAHHFDPALILSLINVESSFKIKAVSPVGARGLMQLMPATARYIAQRAKVKYRGESALFDPFTNMTLGVNYLSLLRNKYRGQSPYFHIAAYNIGPGRLDHLMKRQEGFRPTGTKDYYEKIRAGVPSLRFYPGVKEVIRTQTASQEKLVSVERS